MCAKGIPRAVSSGCRRVAIGLTGCASTSSSDCDDQNGCLRTRSPRQMLDSGRAASALHGSIQDLRNQSNAVGGITALGHDEFMQLRRCHRIPAITKRYSERCGPCEIELNPSRAKACDGGIHNALDCRDRSLRALGRRNGLFKVERQNQLARNARVWTHCKRSLATTVSLS